VLQAIISERKPALEQLRTDAESTQASYEKGKIFEDLAIQLFDSPYLKFYERNVYNTGEIDVAFTVKQINGTLFENLGDMLLVECKNWSVKVDKKEITDFIAKLSRVRANVGILFSRGEITTNAKDEIRAEWRQTGRIIIVITSVDLDKIILGENLYDLLERRFYDAKLS